MGIFKVLLRPFDSTGEYADWVDVTEYTMMSSLTTISQEIDSSEYDLGVFRFSNLQLKFNNRDGLFSDVDVFQSLFRYRRADSQLKVTYRERPASQYGTAKYGSSTYSGEITLFKGLINDESFSTDVQRQDVAVTVLGLESLFARTIVPFDTVDAGDTVSETIFKLLDQETITNLLTVDIDNINPGLDQAIDSIASLQNKTVKEGIDSLLLASNSVLFIRDDVVYVTDRTPTAEVQATFFGQASQNGAETVSEITNLKNGASRVLNFLSWANTSIAVTDSESVTRFGARKKEFSIEMFTDSVKRTNILESVLDEFSTARQEFNVTVPANYETLALNQLDRVTIDYPTVYIPGEDPVPICGTALFDEAVLPEALWTITIPDDEPYKIIERRLNIPRQMVEFRVRKI